MVDAEDTADVLFPVRVGDKLRAARVKNNFDLADIAAKTRIPQRHLIAIESGDYSALPGITYCVGFVKAFARAVGEDETALAADLRIELGQSPQGQYSDYQEYQIADPARAPKQFMIWGFAAVALIIAIGFGVWRNAIVSDPEPLPTLSTPNIIPAPANNVVQQAGVVAAVVAPVGEVVLTAIQPVWMRIYDGADKVLFEKEMITGERFTVPDNANNPQIRTGRADLIAVTVGGKPVPALGPGQRTVKNVGVSAAALAARPVLPAVAPAKTIGSQPISMFPTRP